MKRAAAFLYGILAYGIFFATFHFDLFGLRQVTLFAPGTGSPAG